MNSNISISNHRDVLSDNLICLGNLSFFLLCCPLYLDQNKSQLMTVNLGSGQGYSVLDVIKAFEEASGIKIPYEVVSRRAGDVSICYADPSYALEILGWSAEYKLNQMCEDSWRWQSMNPNGY